MNTAITTIPFHGATLIIRNGDTPETTLVAMKPLVDGMGLSWASQFVKLKGHPVLGQGVSEFETPSAGGPQMMTALPLNRVHFWLATIQPNKVPDIETRERVVLFQMEAADALFEHFFGDRKQDSTVALNNPATLRQLLLDNVERVLALEGQVEEMRPQVQALERIAVADGSMCITDAAKTLQVRPKDLFAFLRSHGWIYRRMGSDHDVAYQPKLASGLLEHKTTTVYRSDGSEKVTTQVRVTPKGLARLAREFPPIVEAA